MFGFAAWGALAYGAPDVTTFGEQSAGASENVVFVTPFDIDAATLTSTTAALPVANLQDKHPSNKWRSSGSTAEAIGITLAEPVAANAVAIVAPNFSASCYVRVRGATTLANLTASPVVDTNWISPWRLGVKPGAPDVLNDICLIRWTNEAALQYWRLDIGEGGSGMTYIEAGRLMIGRYWQPSRNMDYESSIAFEPADIQVQSDYGAVDTDARFNPRTFDLVFSDMVWTDAQERAAELHRRLGRSRDLICVLDPGATGGDFHRQSIHGVLTTGGKLEPQKGWADGKFIWRTGLRIKELLF